MRSVVQVCRAGLSCRSERGKTISAMNEYALSLMNYYIGAVGRRLEEDR